jgi:3-deoxy-D-manno-octulosonate 8-phosphate phosphatase (KDO 8-P phosphatase)
MSSRLFTSVPGHPEFIEAVSALAVPPASPPASGLPSGRVNFGNAQGLIVPTLTFSTELLLQAQGVRVAFFDVDGVLTDGGLYISEQGETLKRFNVLDGHGLKLLQKAGITPVVITGRDSPALRSRLEALGVVHTHYATEDKRPAAEVTLAALGLDWAHAAAMGDDWPDLPVMRRAAISCAPANAHAEVKAFAHFLPEAEGGHGAARAFCDLLLTAGGHYAGLLREYAA